MESQSIQSAELNRKLELLETKRNVTILEVFQPVSNLQNIKPKPMGSNFKDFNPQPGIQMIENGRIKQNNTVMTRNDNKLTVEEYHLLKEGASLS